MISSSEYNAKKINNIISKARKLGLVKPASVVFEKYPPSEEWHEGKIENFIGQKCFECICTSRAPDACEKCCCNINGSLERLAPYCKAVAKERSILEFDEWNVDKAKENIK